MISSLEPYEKILESQIALFLEAIKKKCSIDSKGLHPNRADYPIFRPANKVFFDYEYFEGLLEWFIRDYLITGVFCSWFREAGLDCLTHSVDPTIIRSKYSNSDYGDDYPFAFIIKTEKESIGIRYSTLFVNDRKLHGLLYKYNVEHIEIIDWSDTNSIDSKGINWGVSHNKRNLVYYVTLQKFIKKYFPDSLYDIYIQKVRAAVENANKEIGFQTIPQLNYRFLSDFKTTILSELRSFPLRSYQYIKFDKNGNPTKELIELLPKDAYDIIEKNCFASGLYTSLVGSNDFARCFLTAEYLYQIFRNGAEKRFDYSSIASCYYKSVELLLYEIMQLTFNQKGHEKLYIKFNTKITKKIPANQLRKNPITKEKQVVFSKENEKFFSTELGPLIWFLHDNANGWLITDGRDIIHSCLLNFKDGCRNIHLHKIIIDNIELINNIRDNAFLCLLYLLGACVPPNMSSSLGLNEDSYDKLYKKLLSIPINSFFIQFPNQEVVKVHRLYNQEATHYDEFGNIISNIRFAKVKDFYIEDYPRFIDKLTEKELLIVSRNSMPIHIWWYTKERGQVEVEWRS